ncbi:MAG: hypothetical protein QXF35_01915 [Candidatus Bilamarchaeaceae archaeon]
MNGMKNLVLFLVFAAIASAALSITGYTLSQDNYLPGTQGYVSITITNPSTASADSMTGVVASISSPAEITISSQENIGDVESLGTRVITLPFSIKPDAKSGFYSINIKIGGYTKNPSASSQSYYSTSISVPVKVVQMPIFSIESKENILTGVDYVNFKISNNGGIARDVIVRVDSSSGVGMLGESKLYLGDVIKEKEFTMTLDSRNANDGPIEVPIIIEYKDAIGIKHEETGKVRLTVKKEQLDLLFTQQSEIITKKEGLLVLKVRNNGKDKISNLKIYFINESIRMKDGDSFFYGDLAAGEEKTAQAIVFTTYAPGLNRIPVKITWVEKDIEKEEIKNIPLTITSDADVAVYIEAKPAPLTTGTEHTLSVLVSNLGSYEINNVEVEIESEALQNIDVSNKQYIGNLATDDFSTVQFKVKTKVAPGDYKVKLNINYRDASGEWKTKKITQQIKIYENQKQNGSDIYLFIGVAVVVALLAWYFFLRKKGSERCS